MVPYLLAAIILIGLPTLYIAVRYREYRKFLAGGFFVSLAKIPIPLMWTSAVQSPELSAMRGSFFSVCISGGSSAPSAVRIRTAWVMTQSAQRVRQTGMMGKSLLIFRNRVKPGNQKYSAFVHTQISRTTSPVSRQMRGASRSSRTRGEMRWTPRVR
jgi:hypothetical protein